MAENFPDVSGALCGLLVSTGEHSGLAAITRACADLGAMEGRQRADLQDLMRVIGRIGSGARRPGMTDADAWAAIRGALMSAAVSRDYSRAAEVLRQNVYPRAASPGKFIP